MTTLRPTKSIVIETAVATAVVLAVLAVANVPVLGLGVLHPHPVWLVVLLVAARYGARGLVVAAPIAWGMLAVVAAPWATAAATAVGAAMAGTAAAGAATAGAAPAASAGAVVSWMAGWRAAPAQLLATLATPPELGSLAATVLVGWVASAHERRERASAEKLGALERRAGVDGAAIEELLRRAALALRARNDRLDVSLTFLRGVARRLEGSDPGAAAEAALELATARLGARAAAVLLVEPPTRDGTADGERLAPFAVAGIWSPDGRPVAMDADGTVAAAVRSRVATRAIDLPSSGPEDSDLAAPILDSSDGDGGPLRGVLAVRGVPRGGVSVAALRDLAVIAEWSAGALAGAKSDRGAPARLIAPVRDPSPASPPKAEVESRPPTHIHA